MVMPGPMTDPTGPVGIEWQLDRTLGDYYLQRVRLHMDDSYAGLRMRKFPEDLCAYEHLLWEQRVDVVVELGLGHGGSALWFRDRLRAMAGYGRARPRGPLVISVDADISEGRRNLDRVDPGHAETIRLVEADVRDPKAAWEVGRHVPCGASVMVVEDTAHMYDTTLASLRHFSPLVPVSGYLVVEDGHRDIPGMLPEDMPSRVSGALRAVDDWLASEGAGRFEPRREQERYIVTSSPRGWLQRVR